MKRTKERDREAEKGQQPSKREVICPLIYKLAGLAVNYDLTWQPETKITVTGSDGEVIRTVTGVWKSNPVQRGHTDVFQRELQKMRESGDIDWNESAYYFTHEEGVAARKLYESAVIAGRVKAHISSWGPNPKRADDKSRFHIFTGVTFDELTKKFPELYGTQTRYSGPRAEEKEEVTVTDVSSREEVTEETQNEEPTASELEEIAAEERVAAATATEEIAELIESGDEDGEADDHDVVVIHIPSENIPERIDSSDEGISWKSEDGEELIAYRCQLSEIDTEMWLSEGEWTINGQRYEVRVDN